MADEKIGADMLSDMASLGLEELRSALTGQDMQPIQQAEAPVVEQAPAMEQPSYMDMVMESANRGGDSGQEMEMSR